MHAGPYIRSKIEYERGLARSWRQEADKLEAQARQLREAADKAEAQADWWAEGTDYEAALA